MRLGGLRPVLEMGKPRVLALMCLLTLAGAALSPSFLSPRFPPTPLAGTALFRVLAARAPGLFTPAMWSLAHALGAALVVGLLWLGAALVNDLSDAAIDAISNPGRPLPARSVAPWQALAWALGCQGLAILLVSLEGTAADQLAVVGGAALSLAYSVPPVRLRRSGTAANLVIGAGVSLALLGGMMAQGGLAPRGLLAAGALGILAAAASMVKDFKDVAGDLAAGVRTLPVALGTRGAVQVNRAALAAGYLSVALLLAVQSLYRPVPALAALAGIVALAWINLGLLARLSADPSPACARMAHRRALLIFMGVTVLYVGAQAPFTSPAGPLFGG